MWGRAQGRKPDPQKKSEHKLKCIYQKTKGLKWEILSKRFLGLEERRSLGSSRGVQ